MRGEYLPSLEAKPNHFFGGDRAARPAERGQSPLRAAKRREGVRISHGVPNPENVKSASSGFFFHRLHTRLVVYYQDMKSKKRKTGKKRGGLRSALVGFSKMLCALLVLGILFVLFTNVYMVWSVKDRILTVEEAARLAQAQNAPVCVEVLGAAVRGTRPSPILRDRLDKGLELYREGAAPVLLFSGDNGTAYYNEVNAMRAYAMENADAYGIRAGDIYLDHAGFSTYESMYRLKKVFGADSAIVVTQEYHLYRALYTAEKLGIDVRGVAASPRESGQFTRDVREVIARTKDFCYVLLDIQPKYLGEPITLTPGKGE
jgi:vancomycin permeability regulator SanA